MSEADFREGLPGYFAARQEQHERDIKAALPDLERQMAEFVTAHAGEGGLPVALARMIREVATAAYVRGAMYASPRRVELPRDSVMLFEALETIRYHGDLYPAWRIFTSRQLEEEANDA
jgi:hypothetical protein